MKLLPLGIQTLSEIIDGNYLYVDKTKLVYQLVSTYKYYFLSRPRRFGKSLLVSTLKAYFEGRKDLFKGFAIENLEKDWTHYPVVALSFAGCKSKEIGNVVKFVSIMMSKLEVQFKLRENEETALDKEEPNTKFGDRLKSIIDTAQEQYNQQVVVLIDEYDALMLNFVDDWKTQDKVREHMNNLFSPLKDLEPQLRFVFITGITHFSQNYMFDVVNNIIDITMNENYAEICGLTDNELKKYFATEISHFATKTNKTMPEIFEGIKCYCGNYQFSRKNKTVYNPYSVMQTLSNFLFSNYLAKEMESSPLINHLPKKQYQQDVMTIVETYDLPYEISKSLFLHILRSGFLSMKGYNQDYDQYIVGIPNDDVRTLWY